MLSPTLPPIITALGAEPTWHKHACLSFGAASFPGLHYLRNFLKTGEPWCSSGIPNSQPMASVELGTMQVSHSSLTELADWSFSICCCLGAESSEPCCPSVSLGMQEGLSAPHPCSQPLPLGQLTGKPSHSGCLQTAAIREWQWLSEAKSLLLLHEASWTLSASKADLDLGPYRLQG